MNADYAAYREKYLNSPKLNLTVPVDISLELSSFCNMHCTYCLSPETPVMMADRSSKAIEDLRVGDKLIGFDEESIEGSSRKHRVSTVEKVWETEQPAVKISTTDGDIICSLDHKFLVNFRGWVEASKLKPGDKMKFGGPRREKWEGVGVHNSWAGVMAIEPIGPRRLIDIQTSTRTFYGAGFATHNCYHSDKKNLPFKQRYMAFETFKEIVFQAADLGVHSVKLNWRGESTMNPHFSEMTAIVKRLASGSTFIDRLTNSNFKFPHDRDDIFEGLANQTKVKVSYDSFRKDVFETQRAGGDHDLTTRNIDKFYNWPGRNNQLVIQAVRTSRNADEDIAGEARKRWPSALISIRDMVGGRVEKDLSDITHRERDYSERQSCIQAHARLIFNHDGTAMACCPDIKEEIQLGNIRDMTVAEIFNSPTAKELRADLLSLKAFEKSPCKNCSSYESFSGFKPSLES